MARHQWNGNSSSSVRKFSEEERLELREYFDTVSYFHHLIILHHLFCCLVSTSDYIVFVITALGVFFQTSRQRLWV